MNLAVCSHSYQSCFNFSARLGITLHTWKKHFANFVIKLYGRFRKLISVFRDKLNQTTYDFIFQTIVANQFTSRTNWLHVSKGLAIEAKALIYQVDLFKYESPLLTRSEDWRKEVQGNDTMTAPESHRVKLTCTSLQVQLFSRHINHFAPLPII